MKEGVKREEKVFVPRKREKTKRNKYLKDEEGVKREEER
jgi:hypothetical protein